MMAIENDLIYFLRIFLNDPLRLDHQLGLCGNIYEQVGEEAGKLFMKTVSDLGYNQGYPIDDKTSGLSPTDQFNNLFLYSGMQLILRKELAQMVITKLKEVA